MEKGDRTMSMQLHRDLEVGVMSGTMEKEGFYGEEIQLYGFLYHDAGIKAVINENELTIASEIYNRYQSGILHKPDHEQSGTFLWYNRGTEREKAETG